MKNVTIRQALQHVADHPEPATDEIIALPTHELVARTLFELANSPTDKNRRSRVVANSARRIILNRLAGKRSAGSHPAVRQVKTSVEYIDLKGSIER